MKRVSTIALLSILITSVCYAIPAKPGPRVVTQPDGDTLTVFVHGDHRFNWLTDVHGNRIEQQADGRYVIAEPLTEEMVEQSIAASPLPQCQKRHATAATMREVPLNIAPRGLVILVSFKDKNFTTSIEEMHRMLNSNDYTREYSYKSYGSTIKISSSGSAKKYFYDQSFGQYEPQFDVIGPLTLSRNVAYYGQNYNNVAGQDTYGSDMIVEACHLADNQGVDFSQYDNNGDGYVDFVYVFYAGYGEADGGGASTIWPHSADLTGYYNDIFDGKRLSKYACSNEISYISRQHDGIGTLCHEFSHVLGLPDLYITNNKGIHKTLGEWDILDSGNYNNNSRTPPSYSAYERFFMGWLTPDLLTERGDFELEDIQTSNKCFLLTEKGVHNLNGVYPSPVDFYLLENRQRNSWDKYLPGSGMMITHIRFSKSRWNSNIVNNAEESMGVDIVEADGKTPTADDYINGNGGGYLGKQGDLFPYDTIDKFVPYRESPINHIRHKDGKITFKFKGGTRNINQFVLDEDGTEEVEGIYTFDGHKMGITDLNLLPAGIYIIYKTKNGERVKSSKIVIAP